MNKRNVMQNILRLSDQVKRERAWKQRKGECEKLFWLVLLSSGPHEKLYGPVFCLVPLQPALQYTGTAFVRKEHNGALQTECLWMKWCGVQDRWEFNKESYWQWTPPVLDETMSPLLFISLYIIHLINSFHRVLKSPVKAKVRIKVFPGMN